MAKSKKKKCHWFFSEIYSFLCAKCFGNSFQILDLIFFFFFLILCPVLRLKASWLKDLSSRQSTMASYMLKTLIAKSSRQFRLSCSYLAMVLFNLQSLYISWYLVQENCTFLFSNLYIDEVHFDGNIGTLNNQRTILCTSCCLNIFWWEILKTALFKFLSKTLPGETLCKSNQIFPPKVFFFTLFN